MAEDAKVTGEGRRILVIGRGTVGVDMSIEVIVTAMTSATDVVKKQLT